MKVLVVEDEKKVKDLIVKGFHNTEFAVDQAATIDELFSNMLSVGYDIIILDRLLKGYDSIKYIQSIKRKNPFCKILVLSALSDVEDRVEGLETGADDYLCKPFHYAELLARIRALARQIQQQSKDNNILIYEDLVIRLDSQRVERSGKVLDITPKEYKLLVTLIKKPNRIFSKTEIINDVWEMQHYPESNVVEVMMNHLRNKINKEFDKPLIHSKRGSGYWLGNHDL